MVTILKIQRAHIILQLKNWYKTKIDSSSKIYKLLINIGSDAHSHYYQRNTSLSKILSTITGNKIYTVCHTE